MDFDLARLLSTSSFDNFWYWLMIAVSWSRTTYFTLGAGMHDVREAVRNGGQDMIDAEHLIGINARRLTRSFDDYGVWLIAIGMFLMATIATLGFGFSFELMQAATLFLIGMIFAFLLTLRFAYRIRSKSLSGEALCKAYFKHRTAKQFIGMSMIFVISFYGAFYTIIIRGI
jgi:hypothetical protein